MATVSEAASVCEWPIRRRAVSQVIPAGPASSDIPRDCRRHCNSDNRAGDRPGRAHPRAPARPRRSRRSAGGPSRRSSPAPRTRRVVTFPAIALGGAGGATAQVIGQGAGIVGRQLVPDEAVDQRARSLAVQHTLCKARGPGKVAGAGAAPQPASPLCKAHPSVEDGPCFGLDARDAAFGTPITVTACLRAAGNAATAAWISGVELRRRLEKPLHLVERGDGLLARDRRVVLHEIVHRLTILEVVEDLCVTAGGQVPGAGALARSHRDECRLRRRLSRPGRARDRRRRATVPCRRGRT